jgi:hypothetical protein
MSFSVNKLKGTIPLYFILTDVTDVSLYTSAVDYARIWSITNTRTSETDLIQSTSASTNFCVSGSSILNDTFTVILSAVVDSTVLITTSASLLSSCGPEDPIRFGDNKSVDLSAYLPNYLKESETNELVILIQDFLNRIYDTKTYTNSATTYEIENRPKISVLEKINRLTETHDPDYCDIEYIQYFANFLGYNVDVFRSELGVLADADSTDPGVQEDVKRYLRFIVSNLPHWYKIKTTNNAVKIMLYSFGLIGDLITRYTNDYKADIGSNWISPREGYDSFEDISKDFYPTSHYLISIELDSSQSDFSLDSNVRRNVLNAVESIRPANTVNDGFLGHITRDYNVYMRAYATKRAYFRFNL